MGKTCVICGKPSGMYPLCREHLQMKNNGQVIKCDNCGKWHIQNQPCDCVNSAKQEDKEELNNPTITINEKNKSKCITCGRQTDGLLFCTSCYHKYKSKELYFKITNCSNIELLDENYESKITCKDGHIVKSKAEYMIDNYLYDHGIIHAYEKALPYGAEAKEELHPDFFLPDYLGKGKHVYIEFWGFNENNFSYMKSKKFKIAIYKNLGITLICTYEKTDIKDIEATLDRKLNKKFIKENEINFEEQ